MSVVQSSVPRVPPELWLEILRHCVPSGAPTTMAVQPSKAELRPNILEYRRTLWAACQASRQVGASARICLYQAVLINDCKELLYFFRTLRTVPKMRTLVRSFSWTGVLPQSDADDAECVDLMPSIMAVFASLPPPVTNEDALLPQYLCADSLPAFRVWRLLGVVLAMIPKLTTLFLVLGRSMPAPTYQQYLIDRTLGGGGTAEERANVFRATHQSCEFLAIRVLVMEHIPISIGYPVLPELQVLVLDHISDCAPLFDTYGGEKIVDDLRELCPQLRYIQTKGYLHHRRIRATVRSTSMRSLLLRKTRFLMAELPYIQTAHPNLTSLRIVIFSETGDDSIVHSFEALGKLRYLQYLSVTTPHDLSWHVFDLAPSMSLTMSPFLRGMEYLQHLRVDFIWLAARSNPSQLFHIASLLPPSIKSLHLLDYWGIAITSGLPERYPGFPDDMPAIDFIHLVLEHLLESFTSMGLTSLREVKLSSKEYAKDRWRTTAIRASLNSLTWRFWRAGICFTVTGLEEAREEEDGWWLNLD